MKKSEGGFRDSIKIAFAALAYEHSAEMLPLSEKNKLLSGSGMGKAAKEIHPELFDEAIDYK